MKSISPALAFSLASVTFIIGTAGGYYVSPAYQQTMYDKTVMDLGLADRFIDLRYINAMIAHHRGAILLAEKIALHTERQEIHTLVTDIKVGEPKLIAELYGWKKDMYRDTRVVRDSIVANLGSKDKNSDLRFLNALIAHHEAGIVMTQEIRTKSSNNKILDNADAVEKFLTDSLVTLKEWRSTWYGATK